MRIDVNLGLKPNEPPAWRFDSERLVERYSGRKYDWRTKTHSQPLLAVRREHPANFRVFHNNLLDCLGLAWKFHYGVSLAPDLIWMDLLCEIAALVKETPEKHRHLFTQSSEKQEIVVQTDDCVHMPLDGLMDQLAARVPVDVEVFLPRFSTSDEWSRLSFYAAFADAASPYYDYSTFCCGIPFIELRGLPEDWRELCVAWRRLESLVGESEYTQRVFSILQSVCDRAGSAEFWKNMFFFERCGSGSQVEAKGWYTQLFQRRPPVEFVDNFAPHVGMVDYTFLPTGRKFRLLRGVFGSALEGDALRPWFGELVYAHAEERSS